MTSPDYGKALKAQLAGRAPLLVVNVDYGHPSLVEFLGGCGADVLFFDCEQGDIGIDSLAGLVRAAHAAAKPAVVRLFSPEPWVIERYMQRGVDGIVVPRLDTPAQVRAVVEAVRYCFPKDHESKAVIVQIESRAAAESIGEILAIDGVDAFFIGPVDLSKSLGHGGDYRTPAVAREVERLIATIAGAGRSAGMLVTAETIDAVAAGGATFLYLHTNDFLRAGSRPFIAARNACP